MPSRHSLTPRESPARRDVDLPPQRLGLVRQRRELGVQPRKPLGEIAIIVIARSDADVAAGIEAPALRLYLNDGRHLAQPRHVGVGVVREQLRHALRAPHDRLGILPAR